MKSPQIWLAALLAIMLGTLDRPGWARGFGGGGGGFGGGGGGAFRGGAGGGFGGGAMGGGFHPQGGISHGTGLSGSGYRPSPAARPAMPTPRPAGPQFPSAGNHGGNLGAGSSGVHTTGGVNRPQVNRPGLEIGSRPQLGSTGTANRPNLGTEARPQPGVQTGQTRPSVGNRPEGDRTRPGAGTASLPGLGTAHAGAAGAGNRMNNRPGEGGSGTRWSPSDRGTASTRANEMNNRFDTMNEHWGEPGWHQNQWTGPNGTDINHIGYWGPNGYWGHTGAWGPNGGHWGHTTGVGPNGGWSNTNYHGPAGHWSRSWGWYNGYCPAWGYGRWDYLWDSYPAAMAVGATMWGINVVDSMFGVSAYQNPYYDGPV